jgi:quercetin dioxygenase-like cupin family protein
MITTRIRIVSGVAGIAVTFGALHVSAAPISTEPPTPPIAVEELTRLDEETLVRGAVTDHVSATLNIAYDGMTPMTIQVDNLSNLAVGRFTVQPGAQFPWHTHPGPVLVTVTHGELVYVMADDCSEHSYPAGTAFVDAGHGMIHSAYNPTDRETVIIATFLEMTADGPLSLTEGITGPTDNCGIPAA